MEKRSRFRWIKIPGLLLAICAVGMADATATAGLDEAGLTTNHASTQPAANPGDQTDAPQTNAGVMWLAGLVLILYQLHRKQRSLEQQPVA